jgi:two-component system sensor histidine kinase EvgS
MLNSYITQRFQEDFEVANKYVLKLLLFHWFLATFIVSIEFDTYLLGFVIGGLIFAVAYSTYIFSKNSALFRNVAAVALISYSVLFIQQFMGRIEIHFHIFVILSFLTIYKDRTPMISAAIFITLHHLLFNYLQENNITVLSQPIIVFNYGCGIDIVLLHAVFVLFEAIVLYQIIGGKIDEFKKISASEYKTANLNHILEEKISLRTKELKDAKDEAERANGLKSQFLANMSHEIRTPMNAVIGFTEILKDREKDELNKQYISSIQTSAHSLLNVINDILDISKIEAEKLEIQKEIVNIYIFCDEIISIFRFAAKDKNIELILDIDKSISAALIFDEVRVRQILINLVGNAIKFTKKGYVKLKISKDTYDNEQSIIKLIFEVEDSGMGIKEENLDGIFESFTQQGSQNFKQYGGTGLGLSISKKLANLMDGDISVSSKFGIGSKFTFTINKVPISSILSEDKYSKIAISEMAFERAKILVVDDIELNVKVLRGFFLNNSDIVIDEASNGQEAVDMIKTNDYDLIIMDIKMDIMNGLEASKIIKSVKDIPIIILTASLHVMDTTEYVDYYDSFLSKPVLKATLLEEMAKYSKTKKMHKDGSSATDFLNILDDEKEKIKEIAKKIEDCIAIGNIIYANEILEDFKHTNDKTKMPSLFNMLNKFEIAVSGFDITNIQELLKEIKKL